MPDEIDTTKNRFGAFISRFVAAWHRLGFVKKSEDGEIKMSEVLDPKMGIGYHVATTTIATMPTKIEAIYSRIPEQEIAALPIPGYRALVRLDTKSILSVVTDQYHVVQHVPEFVEFWNILKEEGYLIETAGVLDFGRRVWILFRRPESIMVAGRDELKPYLLLMFDYSGKSAMYAKLVAMRVVCANTAAIALNEKGEFDFRIRHHKNAVDRLKEVRTLLGSSKLAIESYTKKVERLAATPYTQLQMISVVKDALEGAFGNPSAEGLTRSQQELIAAKYKSAATYIEGALKSPEQELAGLGTEWALYNAISQWADHVIAPGVSRDARRANESMFKSQLEGRANTIKQNAFTRLTSKLRVA